MLELGALRVHVVPGGRFALDGGAMFGVVPRVLWEKTDPPDDLNRVALSCNVALIETAGLRVLVDPGLGDKWSDKERRLMRIDPSATVGGGLAELGLRAEEVDLVINTHLHFDHAGGNTVLADGHPRPAFPRARYLVQAGEWEDATHPHERNHASYRPEDFLPLAEAGLLQRLEGEVEVAPGVRVLPVGGHTAHHQVVVVESGGRTLVIPTDLLPTASHLPLPFIMGYDLFPLATLEAKRALLRRVIDDGWWMLFYHDPRVAIGSVKQEGGRYVLDEVRA
jgi:glyoxylase-like metal-dependent hydrolase (beta-lactamase superfamily II)